MLLIKIWLCHDLLQLQFELTRELGRVREVVRQGARQLVLRAAHGSSPAACAVTAAGLVTAALGVARGGLRLAGGL